MKHQALSRVISAVLAVMCLVTLISGVAGFVSAGKDFSQDRSDYKTLRDRIAEAESLDAQLNDVVANWTAGLEALCRKIERNRYLLIFESKDLARLHTSLFCFSL